MKQKTKLMINTALVGVLCISGWVAGHEAVHWAVMKYNGCVNISYDWIGFNVSGYCAASPDWYYLLQGLNEIVGYSIAMPLWLIVFIKALKIMEN